MSSTGSYTRKGRSMVVQQEVLQQRGGLLRAPRSRRHATDADLERSEQSSDHIVSALLEEYAPLHHEADFLLREELRDVSNYHAILLALAQRPMTLTELGVAVGLGHHVQYHLQQLQQLGYVARRQPLSGKRSPRRSVRYVIDDPLL